MNAKLRVIITGATGMVGEGVLHQSLLSADVEKVLVLTRKTCGITHPKLTEVLHDNFFDLSPIENKLAGYNACFFCLGVSSLGMKEPEYYRLTYTLTMHVGTTLSKLNPDMTFCYISGAGTDSTENGKSMWARVKGKTENDLAKLPFKHTYMFRPGFIRAIPGMKHTQPFYKYVGWIFPIGRSLFPRGFCTLPELAQALLLSASKGYDRHVLEGDDIIAAAAR